MQQSISPANTLALVKSGETRYDEEYARHARDALRKFCEGRTQTEAARLLGMNQGSVSRNLKPDRQPSFLVLIRLAKATGRTIDEIIGLKREGPEGRAEVRLSDSSLMRVAEAAAEQVVRKLRSDPPPPDRVRKKKKTL